MIEGAGPFTPQRPPRRCASSPSAVTAHARQRSRCAAHALLLSYGNNGRCACSVSHAGEGLSLQPLAQRPKRLAAAQLGWCLLTQNGWRYECAQQASSGVKEQKLCCAHGSLRSGSCGGAAIDGSKLHDGGSAAGGYRLPVMTEACRYSPDSCSCMSWLEHSSQPATGPEPSRSSAQWCCHSRFATQVSLRSRSRPGPCAHSVRHSGDRPSVQPIARRPEQWAAAQAERDYGQSCWIVLATAATPLLAVLASYSPCQC